MNNLKNNNLIINTDNNLSHSLKSDIYYIQNKHFLQSSLIYSDYNYKDLKISDLIFTIHTLKNIKSESILGDTNKLSIENIDLYTKLIDTIKKTNNNYN